MAETTSQTIEQTSDSKKELKKFQTSYLLFFLGTIFLAISQISLASNINGVPQILIVLSIFEGISYLFYFLATFKARKINKSFYYSLLSFSFFLLLKYIAEVCVNSTMTYDQYMGKALGWSSNFIKCMFYLYFFNGTRLLFDENGYQKHAKGVKVSLAIFASIFILTELFEYFSATKMVRNNRFANRFFLYGFWGLQFLLFALLIVTDILTVVYVSKQRKIKQKEEGGTNNG